MALDVVCAGQNSVLLIGDSNVQHLKNRFSRFCSVRALNVLGQTGLRLEDEEALKELFRTATGEFGQPEVLIVYGGINDSVQIALGNSSLEAVSESVVNFACYVAAESANTAIVFCMPNYVATERAGGRVSEYDINLNVSRIGHVLANDSPESPLGRLYRYEERRLYVSPVDKFHLSYEALFLLLMEISLRFKIDTVASCMDFLSDPISCRAPLGSNADAVALAAVVLSNEFKPVRRGPFAVCNVSVSHCLALAGLVFSEDAQGNVVNLATRIQPVNLEAMNYTYGHRERQGRCVFYLLRELLPTMRYHMRLKEVNSVDDVAKLADNWIANSCPTETVMYCRFCRWALFPMNDCIPHFCSVKHLVQVTLCPTLHLFEEDTRMKSILTALKDNIRYAQRGTNNQMCAEVDVPMPEAFFGESGVTVDNINMSVDWRVATLSVELPWNAQYQLTGDIQDNVILQPYDVCGCSGIRAYIIAGADGLIVWQLKLKVNIVIESVQHLLTAYNAQQLIVKNVTFWKTYQETPSVFAKNTQAVVNIQRGFHEEVLFQFTTKSVGAWNHVVELGVVVEILGTPAYGRKRSRNRFLCATVAVPVSIVPRRDDLYAMCTQRKSATGGARRQGPQSEWYAKLDTVTYTARVGGSEGDGGHGVEISGDDDDAEQIRRGARFRALFSDQERAQAIEEDSRALGLMPMGVRWNQGGFICESKTEMSSAALELAKLVWMSWESKREKSQSDWDPDWYRVEIQEASSVNPNSLRRLCTMTAQYVSQVTKPPISFGSVFDVLKQMLAVRLAINSRLQRLPYNVEGIESGAITVIYQRHLPGNVLPAGDYSGNLILRVAGVGGMLHADYVLSDVALVGGGRAGQQTVFFSSPQALREALERTGEQDLVRRATVNECGNFHVIERMAGAIVEACKFGLPEKHHAIAAVEELQVAIRLEQNERVRDGLNTRLRCAEALVTTIRRNYERLIELLRSLLVRSERLRRSEGAASHCGAQEAQLCTCSEEGTREEAMERLVETMTTGGVGEFFIEGVPGSGKTTMASRIITRIFSVSKGATILVVCMQNAAVDNIARATLAALDMQFGADRTYRRELIVWLSRAEHSKRKPFWSADRVMCLPIPALGEYAELGTVQQNLKGKRIVFCTADLACLWLDRVYADEFRATFLVVDEASLMPIDQFLSIAMRADKVIALGDRAQGEVHASEEDEWIQATYGKSSILSFAVSCFRRKGQYFLQRHTYFLYRSYRCTWETGRVWTETLKPPHVMMGNAERVMEHRLALLRHGNAFLKVCFGRHRSVCVVHVNGQQLVVQRYSSVNLEEVCAVCNIIQHLMSVKDAYQADWGKFLVGVVALHREQVVFMEREIAEKFGSLDWVTVKTVQESIGQTFTFTIFSCVESSFDDDVCSASSGRSLTNAPRQISVASSRHQLGLFLVTNMYRFLLQDSVTSRLLSVLGPRCLFFSTEDAHCALCPAVQTQTMWELFRGVEELRRIGVRSLCSPLVQLLKKMKGTGFDPDPSLQEIGLNEEEREEFWRRGEAAEAQMVDREPE